MQDCLVERAPAKINLFLHLTGKRKDDYHLLESLTVFAELGDILEIYPSESLTLEMAGPFIGTLRHAPENNSIIKAARLLQTHSGTRLGARMILNKRLPVSAGLGGGSSDAAAALRGLIRWWKIPLEGELLQALALSLGSDVPVCLAAQPVIMRGIGEQLTPLAWKTEAWAVLINPYLPLATAAVYRQFDGPFSKPLELPPRIASFGELMTLLSRTRNDLQAAAIALQPAIPELLSALEDAEGCRLARMSGSGATCFGLFENKKQAEAARAQLSQKHPGWWVAATEIG